MFKVGFIGLGIMGKPMAKNVLKAGYPLYVHNRSREAVDELANMGAEACESPKEIAEASDVIITMLPDSPDVEKVVLGEEGVIEGISEDKIVIDMSSINPLVAVKVSEKLSERGAHLLDAPVSGGDVGAIEGILAIMVGGNEKVFEKCKSLLHTMGKSVTRVGEVGAGNTVKLMNQIVVGVNIAAMSEAFAFGKKAGVDLKVAYEAIKGGLAGSRVLDTKIENINNEQYSPGFRVKLHAKDLRNAISMAESSNADMTYASQIFDQFNQLSEQGFADEDHSALHRLFNK
ncbi:2-hydroxy-3-oxopropionate reductase [Aquibacillus albus]|uniref:2-hydroxy-3-oxopropionate reductase n=1 Tax=Aquibacillus albus TaxID=1168171 RepID=A0ABS2MW48_9BACI|nr:2-hydroxy-3-oxopropionate reductase [Aquibacillus albus]MBM7570089.1 2-hydroxy-3-oxopropionate reductase [Aquibacillus albus]